MKARRTSIVLGAVLVAAYLVALALTTGFGPDRVRPLYDGFAPPTPYRWVDPPAFFASGNTAPEPVTATLALGRGGSARSGIATPDGQFVLNLGRGAIAPHAKSKRVRVQVTPVDASRLADVPRGRPNGNAYRVEMHYLPGGASVRRLARAGSLVIEIPEVGDGLVRSRSGARWSELAARTVPPRELSLATTFAEPGYFVGTTTLPELVGPTSPSTDHTVAIGVATGALAVVLLGGTYLVVRRRRRV